jgi:hypothetical protein
MTPLLHSSLLAAFPALLHGFTERSHGNIAFHVGDDADAVQLRQKELSEALGYDLDRLVHMRQIHSDRIVSVDASCRYAAPPECDAVITDSSDTPLMVMVADCTPLLLFEPKRRVIAAVHAGRAGAFENIVGKTVAAMQRDFACDVKQLRVVLGPSIGVCCYEVGDLINEEARDKGFGYAMQNIEGRHCLNVNAILLRQLKDAGVEHIEVMPYCTSCEKERFFSYRAEAGRTGRLAGIIMLKED